MRAFVKVLIAPQEFKGTMTAAQAADAIAKGVHDAREDLELTVMPIAAGGGGTVDAFFNAQQGEERFTEVSGPLGKPVRARWGVFDGGKTAVIEMASASGLVLVPRAERNPLDANTFGTGQLIRAALDAGCKRVLVGAGGSATCDGGTGAASALGVRFLDAAGAALPLGPRHLGRLKTIDLAGLDPRLNGIDLEVLTDVRNPVLGEEGAARTYAPQKGADPDMVEQLERALDHLVRTAREQGLPSADKEPGAGAAGGLAWGLKVLLGAQLKRGFDVISEALGLFNLLNESDLLITGEGRLDTQSPYFKGPYALGRLARMQKRKSVLFAGAVGGPTSLVRDAFDEVIPVGTGPVPSPEEAPKLLQAAAFRWALRQSR